MSLVGLLLTACIALASGGPGQQAKSEHGTSPPFSLSISAPREVVKSGAPLMLKVALTITSDHKLGFAWIRTDEGRNYDLNVRDSDGHQVLPTPPRPWVDENGRKHVVVRGGGSGIAVELAPGQTRESVFDVHDSDIRTPPGKYTIQVRRTDLDGKAVVSSNTISVAVEP